MPERNKEVNFYGDPTPWTVENMVAAAREVSIMMRRQSNDIAPVVTITPKAAINKGGEFVLQMTVENLLET